MSNSRCRTSPWGGKGPEPHRRLPSPGAPHQEGKPPERLALKASRTYFEETQRVVRNKDATSKECTQNLSWQRQPYERRLRYNYVLILECLLEKQGAPELTLGHRHWWQPLGELILPHGHWCWQAAFWSPPSSLVASGPSATSTQSVGTRTSISQAKQLTGRRQGPSSPGGSLP